MTVCTTENPGGTSNAETEELPATKSPRLADASPVSKPSTGWFQITPDANALIRSISTPVDKYTGTANIQVPLASIRTNTGNIPVALSYQASGIKVTDRATIVGLGWRLVAGGKITRQVNGFPENGFTKRFSGALDYETFKEYFRNQKSTEPDIYYFEFPGMSGAFVMDENGNPHTIPYQNLDIKFNSYRFEIKDPAGTVYHFTTQERTEYGSSEEGKSVSYTSTWYLDAIEYMDGTAVGFGYRTGSDVILETSERSSKITVFPRGCYEYNPEGENYRVESQEERVQSVTVTEPKFLEYIRYKDTRVEFLYDDSRSDMSWKRLAKVNVTVKEEILKSFRLIHSSL